MKKYLKKGLAFALVVSMIASLTSCSLRASNDEETENEEDKEEYATEIKQNDYRGSFFRTYVLQEGVLGVMDNMKQNNVSLREENPNSFWSKEGYQDFVVNFLTTPIMDDTQFFGEENLSWEERLDKISSYDNSFTYEENDEYELRTSVKIRRNEKDDYSVYCSGSFDYNGIEYEAPLSYSILYDCDKDWAKAYAETDFNASVPTATVELYEYARLNENTFAVQSSTERLIVVFENTDEDMLLSKRTVKEFYYSKLINGGERTTFTPYKPKSEIDTDNIYNENNVEMNNIMSSFPFLNEKGDICSVYGKNDSIFLSENIQNDINSDWVFEDKSLQQGIIYKDGALVVVTYNKLTESYERFIYTLEGVPNSTADELANMIEIKDLVGVQKPKTSYTEKIESDNKADEESPYPKEGKTAEEIETAKAGATDVNGSESKLDSSAVNDESRPETAENSSSDSDSVSSSEGTAESSYSDENSTSESNSESSESGNLDESSLSAEEIEEQIRRLEEMKKQQEGQ